MKRKKSNEEYWHDRMVEEAQHRFDLTNEQMQKELKAIYSKVSKKMQGEVQDLYYKMLEDNISRTDLYNYKRYRDLEGQINKEMVALGEKEVKLLSGHLEWALDEIYKETQTPNANAFALLSPSLIKEIVNRPWSAQHFTATCWKNKELLAEQLKKGISESLITGKSKNQIKKAVMNTFNVGYSNADRVVRTELMHTINMGQVQRYKDNGYTQLRMIVGDDERTCESCMARADKIIDIDSDEIPPFHPRCRCSVVPVIDGQSNKSVNKMNKEKANERLGIENNNTTNDNWTAPTPNSSVSAPNSPNRPLYNKVTDCFKSVTLPAKEKAYYDSMVAELLDLQNTYPVAEGMVEVTCENYEGTFGYAQSNLAANKTGRIAVFRNVLNVDPKSHATLEESNRQHEYNYTYKGSKLKSVTTGLTTFNHEYGHTIDFAYYRAKNPEMLEALKKYVVPQKVTSANIDEILKLRSEYNILGEDTMSYKLWTTMRDEYHLTDETFNDLVRKELGTYAASARWEFLSEGFANMRCLKEEEKTPFIKRFEELFNKEYDEVLGGNRHGKH